MSSWAVVRSSVDLLAEEAGGEFHGEDKFTTRESERLLRLPMYYNLTEADSDKVIEKVIEFYKG